MAVNKYPADCMICGHTVPANGGTLKRSGRRWLVRHIACGDGASARPAVIATTFFGSHGPTTVYQNVNGSCEDAPCCGCCTY